MTRTQAYAEGFQEGRRWAEEDIANHSGRFEPTPNPPSPVATNDQSRALQDGLRRGYRDTWARWDAGTLTAQMLELAPVNR